MIVELHTPDYTAIRSNHLTEQLHLLSYVGANADILLTVEPLSEYIQHRFFSDNEPLPGDPSHLLQMHYT
jgi:hypothetical protein